jgi:hypothetical protein
LSLRLHPAFDHGINVIDTAPVYGFGRSEEIVGKAIAVAGLVSACSSPPRSGLNGGMAKSSAIPAGKAVLALTLLPVGILGDAITRRKNCKAFPGVI